MVGCDAGTCPAGVSAPRSICFFPGCGPGPLLALGRFAVAQPHRSHLSVLVGCQAGRHKGKGRMAGGCWRGGSACAGLRDRGSGGSGAARPGWAAAAFPLLRLQLGILGPCLPPPTMPLACSDQRTRERLRGGLGHQTGLTGGVQAWLPVACTSNECTYVRLANRRLSKQELPSLRKPDHAKGPLPSPLRLTAQIHPPGEGLEHLRRLKMARPCPPRPWPRWGQPALGFFKASSPLVWRCDPTLRQVEDGGGESRPQGSPAVHGAAAAVQGLGVGTVPRGDGLSACSTFLPRYGTVPEWVVPPGPPSA